MPWEFSLRGHEARGAISLEGDTVCGVASPLTRGQPHSSHGSRAPRAFLDQGSHGSVRPREEMIALGQGEPLTRSPPKPGRPGPRGGKGRRQRGAPALLAVLPKAGFREMR